MYIYSAQIGTSAQLRVSLYWVRVDPDLSRSCQAAEELGGRSHVRYTKLCIK